MIEEWKDVIGFEDKYQISNLGNIRLKDNNLFKVPIMELIRAINSGIKAYGFYWRYYDRTTIKIN